MIMLTNRQERAMPIRSLVLLLSILSLSACRGAEEEPRADEPDAEVDVTEEENGSDETVSLDVADPTYRIVAVGDVHGDLNSAREALRLAGAINDSDQWIGGELIVVQVGDQLDRGDDEREILDLFERLRSDAAEAGGAFHPLLGNHEVMNVELDLRYVTEGGFADFADIPYDDSDPLIASYEPAHRGRVAAFRPGGPYATLLSEHPMIFVFDGNVFVHGGVVPRFAEYGIDLINEETSAWMRGEGPEPSAINGDDCPIWSRHYSDETDAADCLLLEQTLQIVGAERMIVAHTVQDTGINSACDGQVWRVDVGLSDYYGGATQVLEIEGDRVRPILGTR